MKGQKWVLVQAFDGAPKEADIQLQEFELPSLKENEVLLQSVYMTVDPYMKGSQPGAPMIGQSLAEVIESKNPEYPVGMLVLGYSGWQSHYISNGSDTSHFDKVKPVDNSNVLIKPISFDIGSTKISYTLGTLGMPGATAYCGLNKCSPKKGETLFVSSAAGAVGHVVGQLAKIWGLTVIGSASTQEKMDWLKELGFDHVINYKTQNVFAELKRVAPEGIDIYFDNVGGDHYHNIINSHMRKYGRVLVCGSIQTYCATATEKQQQLYAATNFSILGKELTVYGFMVPTYAKEWPAAFTEMNGYIQSGQMKTRETEFVGFEKMSDAFMEIFKSTGIGKQVIKCVNEKTKFP